MKTSESTIELTKALLAFQKEVESVPKTADNPFFKSKYASLPAVVEAAQALLSKNGLAVTQGIDHDGAIDTLTTRLMHESGEWIEGEAILHLGAKGDAQAHGSAVTYGRRYGYMAILGLVADEDDDGNKASKPARKEREKSSSGDFQDPLTELTEAFRSLGYTKKQGFEFINATLGGDPYNSLSELSDVDLNTVLKALAAEVAGSELEAMTK